MSGTEKVCRAICDNDGGRMEQPIMLVRHIYPLKTTAEQAQLYEHLDERYFPIRRVTVRLMEE
ncbi:MAG TPA: hypothetical protein ENN06_12620 [Desulfobacteraceae bacterium]|nr:hypothetical protein [Desulfobacteraceae bacterium]